MREGQQREIPIRDCRYHVFLALLEFLYTDNVLCLYNYPFVSSNQAAVVTADASATARLKGLAEAQGSKDITSEGGVEFALELLSLADQYLVGRLKRFCENAVEKSIRSANVARMLRIADQRMSSDLRRKAFHFILKHFGEVIATADFATLPPHLLQEVLAEASRRGATLKQPP